jgi:hypothetical protein
MRKFLRLCLTISVLAVGGNPAGVVQQAQARWKPQYTDSPYREWYQAATRPRGLVMLWPWRRPPGLRCLHKAGEMACPSPWQGL